MEISSNGRVVLGSSDPTASQPGWWALPQTLCHSGKNTAKCGLQRQISANGVQHAPQAPARRDP
jgi:hypothetical protein